MKKHLLIFLGIILMTPLLVGAVDLMSWFYFDHQLSSIDWNEDSQARVCLALMSTALGIGPLGLAHIE